MPKTTVIITVDGYDPEYIEACEAPNLMALAQRGFYRVGKSMMPSVTNVNNVSIVTGEYPSEHGISSNYRMVRETGEDIYMESGEYILSETLFQRASKMGARTILSTSKDKLRTLLLTADHGMNPKKRMVDLALALEAKGIGAEAVPIIKDRYVVHHNNLGGCMFIYLHSHDAARTDEAAGILRETPGVERVYSRKEAADELRLNYDRIGDLVVTGDFDTVFGPKELEDSWDDTGAGHSLRSHASAHEQDVPIIGYNGDFDGFAFTENRDIGRYVFERVLGHIPSS